MPLRASLRSGREEPHAIRAFKSDRRQPIVLVNFGVLTTGFDAPKATAGPFFPDR